MNKVLLIARKEFRDLSNNRVVLLILAAYLLVVAFMVWDFNFTLHGGRPGAQVLYSDNVGVAAANYVFFTLTWLGTIIGITVGCSTIASERMGNALNTLIVKPLYRDTIINGKLLGSFAFMACIIILIVIFFTVGFFMVCWNDLARYLADYLLRLPFVFLFTIVYMSIFLSASLLISLLVRDQAFAMILSTLTVYVSLSMSFPNITSCLDKVLPGFGFYQLGNSLSPYLLLMRLQDQLMNTGQGALESFLDIIPDTEKLLVYVVIAIILSYIIFIRRDIT